MSCDCEVYTFISTGAAVSTVVAVVSILVSAVCTTVAQKLAPVVSILKKGDNSSIMEHQLALWWDGD